jgi:3-oxoacyl-[acyl-carrier-protein] synthase II
VSWCSRNSSTPSARGAKIYAEVVGYGLTGDAYHITAPAEDGDGAFRCMTAAIKRAGLKPADIDYINAHGTSTMADTIELAAVERLVGDAASKASMSSTKSRSATFWALPGPPRRSSRSWRSATTSCRRRSISTIRNARRRSISCRTRRASGKVDVALSNSFGFGGTNASLVFRRYDA